MSELSKEDEIAAQVTKAVEAAADKDGNVKMRATLRGGGLIATGKKPGDRYDMGDEFTVPSSVAVSIAIKGFAEPVQAKKAA